MTATDRLSLSVTLRSNTAPATSLDRLCPARFVLTACGVEALIVQAQSLHWPPADNVRLDNFIDVIGRDKAVPHRFRIDDEIRAVLALIEAAGLVGSHPVFQSALG